MQPEEGVGDGGTLRPGVPLCIRCGDPLVPGCCDTSDIFAPDLYVGPLDNIDADPTPDTTKENR